MSLLRNRRKFIACGSALFAAQLLAFAPGIQEHFDDSIIIDGLGFPFTQDMMAHASGTLALPANVVEQVRASGVTAWQDTVGAVGNDASNWEDTLSNIGFIDRFISANPDVFVQGKSARAIRDAKAGGKSAIIYGTQDTAMVGTDLDRLDILNGLDVRVVQLTYNLRNLSGDGALEPANGGLSKLGHTTIERIESNKQLLDLSHGGQRTIAEAIAATKRPATISHTGCRALNNNPRNVSDESMRALAEKGGVVGIYWMAFLVQNSKPTAADLVRHMTHAVNVCGEDHVGIGTDGILFKTVIDAKAREQQKSTFEQRSAAGLAAPGEGPDVFNIIPELDGPMRFRQLRAELSKAGWSEGRIEKVFGANLLRLYTDAWGG